jgi:hypothetical protein
MASLVAELLLASVRGALIAFNGLLVVKYLAVYHDLPPSLSGWIVAACGALDLSRDCKRAGGRIVRVLRQS